MVTAEIVVLSGASLAVVAAAGPAGLARISTWAALAVVAVVAAVAALWATNRFASALSTMIETAESVGAGDEDQRFREDRQGELGRLAIALDEMRQSLVDSGRKVRDENRQISSVLQSMSDGVIAVDTQHRITLINEATHNLLRLNAKAGVGRSLLEATRSRPLYDAVVLTLSRPGPYATEIQVSDTQPRYLLLRANRLPGDPCPGVVVVLHDVTELRRLENLRKEFVANVSHELKTPLASIKAYAETLLGGAVNDPENNFSFVQRIQDDAERLHQLILDMLRIARIESHQQVFHVTDMALEPVVSRCVDEMQPHANAKAIMLHVELPPEPTAVRADAEGVHTIIANLVDNAIKYTPEGGQVTVRVTCTGETGMVEVEDSGPGIDRAHQERIFERFYRVDRARGRDIGGTGLGLSIVKHLVQAFEGSVSVTSQLGKGSRFQVRLPLGELEKAGT